MNDDAKQMIKDEMAKLPTELRRAVSDSGWEEKVLEIGRRHGLHIDQLGILQIELSLAIVGLVDYDQFFEEIKSRLELPTEEIQRVIDDLNKEVFSVIRDRLKYHLDNSDQDLKEEEKETLEKHGISFDVEEKEDSEKVAIKAKPEPEVESSVPKNPKVHPSFSIEHKLTQSTASQIDGSAPKVDPYREPIE